MAIPQRAEQLYRPPVAPEPFDLIAAARTIGADVARPAAASVDRESRFPAESIAALREARLLGALVPRSHGGLGCSVTDIAEICQTLGEHCANSAMVYAMHQIQVACVVRHSAGSSYFERYLDELTEKQLLLASATSEVGVGGDVRTSICAVERQGDRFTLQKRAPVISYGEHTDDILVTARRGPDSPPSDQVMVLARKADTTLQRTSDWNALGFRGTCSCGFLLETAGAEECIMPDAYGELSSATMLPFSHILWSSIWLGIATDAVNRARQFIRDAARKAPGSVPPGATRLAELVAQLQMMRALVSDALKTFERNYDDRDALSGIGFALQMNSLKLQASRMVVDIAAQALSICGIAGYTIDSKYSVERHLRDAYGAGIMINNDRILGASASMLLVHRDEAAFPRLDR
jgi:acyl-CoA dehydrogenase